MAGVAGSCASCGNSLSADDRFCGVCGTPVPVATPVATAPRSSSPAADLATPELAPPPAAPKLNKRLVVGLAAGVGLLLVIAAGVIVGSNIAGSGSNPQAYSEATDESDGTTTTEEDTDTGQTDTSGTSSGTSTEGSGTVTPARVEFASISGNIRCRIEASGVTCHMGEHTYAKPPQACTAGPKGTTVGLDQAGITWPCLSSDIVTTNVLPYDTNINAHNYDCSINYVTGVTCVNSSKQGFQMEYDNGITGVG